VTENMCPICAKGRLVERRGAFSTKYVDRSGVERVLTLDNVDRLQCDACGEEILADVASRKIEDARRAAMGLLGPTEIRDLRYRFGKTQVQMSHLLGVGEKTYCRWESGSFIQSVAFDNYLRLVRDVPEAIAVLTRLEHHEAKESFDISEEDDLKFVFLKNITGVAESAARFTGLMTTGMLHVLVRE
jgi:putative zinc finger/helix-turn-helix YgiT family protein